VSEAPVVGVIGGGQLARMMQPAAIALGVRLRLLAESPSDCAAAAIPDTVVGTHHDLDVLRGFASGCDVITFDHEHVPTAHLRALVAAGVQVRPGPDALEHAQDKLLMRRALSAAGIPVPDWAQVESLADVTDFAADRWPVVLKTPRGGYDGKGVRVVETIEQAAACFADWTGPLLAEERVPFHRELAAMVARTPSGQAVAYPVVQTVQTNGVCTEVVAPAGIPDEHAVAAQRVALKVAESLGVTGVLAVEMFETADGVLVNELAMRQHNSGHWSIDGAVTSQFEQHLRAVLDWPLGAPTGRSPVAVMVNVLGGADDVFDRYPHLFAHDPAVKVHWYGKEVRPGRKVGHVTVVGHDESECLARARHAAQRLAGDVDE
jgi:5-(carboxyamino)imidazole ribonucleotide synthase